MGAISLSLLLHGLLIIPVLLTPLPKVDVDAAIEVSVAPPAPEPEMDVAESPTENPAEPPAETSPDGRLAKPKTSKARSASSAALSTARELAPSGARVVVLVRAARLRPHPDLVELSRAVMALLPDYHWAMRVGLDPIDDFSLLLVATANPYDVTETFVAALMDEAQAQKGGDDPAPPGGADPRVVERVPPDVLLLGRPDHVAAIGNAWAQKLHTAVKSKEGAVLEATVARLRGNLAFEGIRMPLPERAAGRVFVAGTGESVGAEESRGRAHASSRRDDVAGASPSLVLDLEYASEADATEVAGLWPQIEARIGSSAVLAWMGLSDVASGAAVEQQKNRVVLKLDLAPRHVRALSRVLGLLLGRLRGRVHNSGEPQ